MKKWVKIALSACLAAALLAIWGISFANANNVPYRPMSEYYKIGNDLEIGLNFFDVAAENPDGYIIRVNNATVRDYRTYYKSLSGTVDEESFTSIGASVPKYVYDVEVTLTNTYNTDGLIYLNRYELQCGAMTMPVDFEIWNLLTPQLEGNAVFRLKPGTTEVIHFPFVEQPMNSMAAPEKTNKTIETGTFYLCVSYCPTRKLIELNNVKYE